MNKRNQKLLFLSAGLFLVTGLILTACTQKTPVENNNGNNTNNVSNNNTQNQTNNNSNNNTNNNQNNQVDEYKSWKTYRNEEYGFEVKYPKNKFNVVSEEHYIHFYDKKCVNNNNCENINITIAEKPTNVLNLEDLIKENLAFPLDLDSNYNQTRINNYDVIVSNFNHEGGINYAINVIFLGDSYYYQVKLGGQFSDLREEDKSMFNKFLKTFDLVK